ncbi:trichome birefringence-like protein 13, partial [Tanacetum coccineum]
MHNQVSVHTHFVVTSRRQNFRSEPSYVFVFKDYKSTLEFFMVPLLVQELETIDQNGSKKETMWINLMRSSAHQNKTADIVVFNTRHWCKHDKTAKWVASSGQIWISYMGSSITSDFSETLLVHAELMDTGFVGDSLNRNMLISLFCYLRCVSCELKKWRPAGSYRGFTFLKYKLTMAYHRTNLLARYGRWSANSKGGELEALGYKEGYRVDVDIPEATWAEALIFHDILIYNTSHWWWAPSKFDPVKSPCFSMKTVSC